MWHLRRSARITGARSVSASTSRLISRPKRCVAHKSLRERSALCVAPAEVQTPVAQNFVNVGRTKINAALHVICARCLRLQTWPRRGISQGQSFGRSHLRSDARVDTSTARYIRCLCPPNVPRSCNPNRSKNRVRIDLEGEVLQSIVKTQQQLLSARVYDGLFAS